MDQMPPIKAVMTPFPHLIEASATIAEAEAMMQRHDIRHLPVREGDHIVGLITVADIARARQAGAGAEASVRDVGIAQVTTFELTDSLDRVLTYMAETHVECVLIVKQDRLAGIFTLTDACRCFADFLHAIFPPKGGDDAA